MSAILRQALFITFVLVVQTVRLDAQWPVDPTKNLEVLINATGPVMVSDGFGGAIVVAPVSVSYPFLVGQRVDRDGYILWDRSLYGVKVAQKRPLDTTVSPALLADGHGGVFVVYLYSTFVRYLEDYPWEEYDDDLYVQHIDSDGVVLWGDRGLMISANWGRYGIVTDGESGMIVTWADGDGTHAQRFDEEGRKLWGDDGIIVSSSQYELVVSDGDGGAIVMPDYGPGGQRIGRDGQLLWDEMEVDSRVGGYADMVSDEEGGIVICGGYYDHSTGKSSVRAQRIDARGVELWSEQGTIIQDESTDRPFPRLAYKKGVGAFLVWNNYWGESNIYAQKLTCDGQIEWDGILSICEASGGQSISDVAHDGEGGAVFVWEDGRGGVPGFSNIYTQRVSGDGHIQWKEDGIPVSFIDSGYDVSLITDSFGNSIVVWYTLGRKRSTFIQKIDKDGDLGGSKGDVNRDGAANIIDALRVANSIIGVGPILSEYERWASDTNDDGEVNIQDLIDIVNRILGIRPG